MDEKIICKKCGKEIKNGQLCVLYNGTPCCSECYIKLQSTKTQKQKETSEVKKLKSEIESLNKEIERLKFFEKVYYYAQLQASKDAINSLLQYAIAYKGENDGK